VFHFQHYLPLDNLNVHKVPSDDVKPTREEDDTDVDSDGDDGIKESTAIVESKNRRKNSKFLERKQRQVDAKISSTTTTTTTITTTTIRATTTSTTQAPNEDDTFESLATEAPTKKVDILHH